MSSKLLDNHDFDELDALLSSVVAGENLGLDGVHGLLSALAAGPGQVGPDQWLPLALGRDPRAIHHDDLDRLIELLLTLREAIDYALDHYSYEPVLMEHHHDDGDSDLDPEGWCVGFAAGVDLLDQPWTAALRSEPSVREAATLLQSLGVSCDPFTRCLEQPPAIDDFQRERLIQRLPASLIELRQYWEEQRDDHPPHSHRLH